MILFYSILFTIIFFVIAQWTLPNIILIRDIDMFSTYRKRNRNKFNNQIRAPGGHIQITIMIDTQQQYIKINIRGEIPIIVVPAH